jgi:hypothetical protein
MDFPEPFPSATTAYPILESMGTTSHFQVGVLNQEHVGEKTLYELMANETNLNINFRSRAAGGSADFTALAGLMPTGSVLHPPIYLSL